MADPARSPDPADAALAPTTWRNTATGVDPSERQALVHYVDAMYEALAATSRARPEAATWAQAATLAESITGLLAPWAVPEERRIVGRLSDQPGRAQLIFPRIRLIERTRDHVDAEVELDAPHLGANNAAHGGVLPMVFDELLGQLSNVDRSKARTAYLHVDYRAICPIGVPIALHGEFVREEGRKRLLRGTARAEGVLVAEVEGLFVELRPGQP